MHPCQFKKNIDQDIVTHNKQATALKGEGCVY